MKHTFHFKGLLLPGVLFVFLLISVNTTTAKATRPLISTDHLKQGKDKAVNMEGLTQVNLTEKLEEDSSDLMGLEHCDDGDEECVKRRLISEAHLDYIYTQHQKP